MRDAPHRIVLTRAGAARSVRPLAKLGPMSALEASEPSVTLESYAQNSQARVRPSPIPRAARRASTEFGGGGSAQPRRGEHWTVRGINIPPSPLLPPHCASR